MDQGDGSGVNSIGAARRAICGRTRRGRIPTVAAVLETLLAIGLLLGNAQGTAASGLEGPTWRLVTLGDRDEPALAAAAQGVTAQFANGVVTGFSGCNRYRGGFTLEGNRLTVGPLAGTKMACPPPAMAIETAFHEALAGTSQFTTEQGQLILTSTSGLRLLFRAEAAASLEGLTWEVTGYNNGRQAVVSPVPGTELTLAFRDGTVTGSTGCNRYHSPYSIVAGGITVGAVATTRMACPGEGVMAQEQAFVQAFSSASTWSIQGEQLELRTVAGALAVTARRGPRP